jgi:hypothetical protein
MKTNPVCAADSAHIAREKRRHCRDLRGEREFQEIYVVNRITSYAAILTSTSAFAFHVLCYLRHRRHSLSH